MSNTATAPAASSGEGKAGGRGKPPGRLVVGDYVGVPAAQAAQSVRRAGLTPGVDRSLGCEPALIGVVIAQEPPAGSELARNGMVTLYAGVPDAARTEATNEATGARVELHEASPPAPSGADTDVHVPPPETGAARRRKPGRGETRAGHMFDPAPEPKTPGPDTRSPEVDEWQQQPPESQPTPTDRDTHWDGDSLQTEVFEPSGPYAGGQLAAEELVARADDMFAGRTPDTPAWSSVHPARDLRPLRGAISRARSHPLLTVAVGATVATWVVVAVLVGLANPRVQATAAKPPSPAEHASRGPTTLARRTVAKATPATTSRVQRGGLTHSVPRVGHEPGSQTRVMAPAAAAAAGASSPPGAPAPQSTATARGSQSEGQQTGGGPFSP